MKKSHEMILLNQFILVNELFIIERVLAFLNGFFFLLF